MEGIGGSSKQKMKDQRDLAAFLSKVDQVESIIKGFSVNDETAVKKADEYITKHFPAKDERTSIGGKKEVNRTVINPASPDRPASGPEYVESSTEGFMSAMEEDCRERSERKKLREAEANVLKEEGNKEFSAGHFENAIKLYTQAIESVKYWSALYTNRAQAFMRLGDYKAAIEDCTWAFRADETCLKAFIIQGKAYVGLKEYNKAVDSYQKATDLHPSKSTMIAEYIAQVRISREAEEQEHSAAQQLSFDDTGCVSLVDVLKKCSVAGQIPVFYTGGLNIINNMIKTVTDKVLLRTHGGLAWNKSHPFLSKYFLRAASSAPQTMSVEEGLTCATYLDVLCTACTDCEKNECDVLEQKDLLNQLIHFTELESSRELALSAVNLLHQFSTTERGRAALNRSCDVLRLSTSIFSRLSTDTSLAVSGLGLLNNLALDKKFVIQDFDRYQDRFLSSFEALMTSGTTNTSLISLTLSYMLSCCGDRSVRKCVASRASVWNSCLTFITQQKDCCADPPNHDAVCSILSFLACLTLEPFHSAVIPTAVSLSSICCHLLNQVDNTDMRQRSLMLLSRLLSSDVSVVDNVCELDIVTNLLSFLLVDDVTLTKLTIVCLTACTLRSETARAQIVSSRKGLSSVVKLLRSSDDSVVGNTALCLSHCVATESRAGKALAKTDIIKDLLVLARDQDKPTVQHNCAILIAKLAASQQCHLERLRELHGLEILHTVLQHVKS